MMMKMTNGEGSNEEPRGEEPAEALLPDYEDEVTDFSQMFRDFEDQLLTYRALLMQRLVMDPFYRYMNVSPAARMWMLRHLKHLACYAEDRYGVNLLQFFELMNLEDVATFLRQKNAPSELIAQWNSRHPSGGPGPSSGASPSA